MKNLDLNLKNDTKWDSWPTWKSYSNWSRSKNSSQL